MKLYCRSLMTALLIFVTWLAPPAAHAKKYAVVIGVQSYNPEHFTSLRCAKDDAIALGKVLADLGFAVLAVHEDQRNPTFRPSNAEKIRRVLKARCKHLEAGDTLVVFLSGHGIQLKSDKPKAATQVKESYFCPEDAVPAKRETLLPLSEVYAIVDGCGAGRKLLLVDACRNEVVAQGDRAGTPVELDPIGLGRGNKPTQTALLLSCGPDQKSWEDPKTPQWPKGLGHGVFAAFVMKYLRGEAGKSYYRQGGLTLYDMVNFVRKETYDYTLTVLGKGEQYPDFFVKPEDWQLASLKAFRDIPVRPIPDPGPPIPNGQPGKSIKTKIGLELVYIKPGRFKMGSPKGEAGREDDEDQVDVTLTKGFYLGLTAVTQGQYQALTGRNPSYFCRTGGGAGRVKGVDTSAFPVEYVSWYDAVEYCNLLSEKEGLRPYYALKNMERREDGSISSADVQVVGGDGYRLPTEAEWEYACRAGTTTPFAFGNVLDKTNANVEYDVGRPTKAGSYKPNAWGLYDMHGNVWEWCEDWYHAKLLGGRDPVNHEQASDRVRRGGSWSNSPRFARSAGRHRDAPEDRSFFLGFRVARRSSE